MVQYRPLGLAINGMGTQLYAGPVPYFFLPGERFLPPFPHSGLIEKEGRKNNCKKGW